MAYIEIGGQVNGMFRRNIIVELDKKDEAIKRNNFTDTYSTIYQYDNRDQNIANFIAPLYIDLDAENLERDYEKLKRDVFLLVRRLKTLFNIKDENIELYFSGSKGFHILIPYEIFNFEYSKDLNSKYKILATELKSYTITKSVDTRIYDNKRLFREPNSINSKTGYYKVQLTLSDLKAMNYEDLIKYASKPRDLLEVDKTFNKQARQAFDSFIEQAKEKQKRSINYNVARTMLVNKELLPCVKYILANGAVKGGRNNTAMALASALLQREMNEQKVLEIMKEWNAHKLDEPLPEREIEATTRSAYNNVKDGKRYGCGAFIDLGICIKGCPVRK